MLLPKVVIPSLLKPRIYLHLMKLLVIVLAVFLYVTCTAQPSLRISSLYTSGSVWQRGQPITIHGRAAVGTTVTLLSNDVYGTRSTTTDAAGVWTLQLPPKPAGGPYAFTFSDEINELLISDVYLGDVYLLSGQSNMEWRLIQSVGGEAASAKTNPYIRHLNLPHRAAERAQNQLPSLRWESAKPGKSQEFSAVGYYFAEALLERDPTVAIGLINASWGGSRIEAWLPRSSSNFPAAKVIDADVQQRWQQLRESYPAAFAERPSALQPHQGGGLATQVGTPWEYAGYPELNGRIWFDRSFSLSAAQAQQSATLALGAIDDSDRTYLNGRLIGAREQAYDQMRRYAVPAEVLRPGINQLSVWIEDTGGGGGMMSSPDSIYLQVGDERLALGGGAWTSRPEQLVVDTSQTPHHVPTLLYNGMLAPLQGIAASAVLWYQGESNANSKEEALRYGGQLRTLRAAFRALADDEDLPFLVVELPEWLAPVEAAYQPDAHWAWLRQAQRSILDDARSSTVVTLGLGDASDIHPRNKRPVGQRLANEARRILFNEQHLPTFARALQLEFVGQTPVVRFSGVGEGLRARSGVLAGFAVKGADGIWYDADAVVQTDDRIRIVPPVGVQPVAVSYAWANNPAAANLVNGYELPVSSFMLTVDE